MAAEDVPEGVDVVNNYTMASFGVIQVKMNEVEGDSFPTTSVPTITRLFWSQKTPALASRT
jgi:hypothetical protein